MTQEQQDASAPMMLELLDPEVAFANGTSSVTVLEPFEVRTDLPSVVVMEDDPELRHRLTILALAVIGMDPHSVSGDTFFAASMVISRVVNVFTLLGVEDKLAVRKAFQEA